MPRHWTPYLGYQGSRIKDMGMNGGRQRGEKVHVSSQLRPSFAKSFVLLERTFFSYRDAT
jgi:hypothetical protein